jgi:hypothetical protein
MVKATAPANAQDLPREPESKRWRRQERARTEDEGREAGLSEDTREDTALRMCRRGSYRRLFLLARDAGGQIPKRSNIKQTRGGKCFQERRQRR